ncbi:MAG: helix-turn-helix transcriptional regulator [Clostridia bacterium]|nr:helix-turn-helix transcriptional regulator [Clostridia bacterium]
MKLKEIRLKQGLKQYQVADFLNTTQHTISNYEKGTSQPNIETIIKLAKYFNVSTDELLGLSQAETNETVLTNKIKLLNEEELFKLNVFADALLSLREHEEKNK